MIRRYRADGSVAALLPQWAHLPGRLSNDLVGQLGRREVHCANREVLAELAGLIADGQLEVPIGNAYPLAQVREAYTELERRHTRGKIVLRP